MVTEPRRQAIAESAESRHTTRLRPSDVFDSRKLRVCGGEEGFIHSQEPMEDKKKNPQNTTGLV